MTLLRKWLRNLNELLFGRYYEGPEPPERLGKIVIAFANLHPRATRGDWVSFAQGHAEEAYRSGYVRGLEWAERDLDRKPDRDDPERIADDLDANWRWQPAFTLQGDPLTWVVDQEDSEAIAKAQLELLKGGQT